jgi:hypothetical protein
MSRRRRLGGNRRREGLDGDDRPDQCDEVSSADVVRHRPSTFGVPSAVMSVRSRHDVPIANVAFPPALKKRIPSDCPRQVAENRRLSLRGSVQ